jgi:hypothetical protein
MQIIFGVYNLKKKVPAGHRSRMKRRNLAVERLMSAEQHLRCEPQDYAPLVLG